MCKAFTSENITCDKYGAVQLDRQVKLSGNISTIPSSTELVRTV